MPILLMMLYMALIGVVAWLLITYVPMPQPIKTMIVIAAVVCCVLILLSAVGVGVNSGPIVPRLR